MTATPIHAPTIVEAIRDAALVRPFLAPNGELRSWRAWQTALKCIYGLPIKGDKRRELVTACTGRDPAKLPAAGFQSALLLCGRRSGKSKIAAVIGAHEALFGGHAERLSPGETGLVAVCSPTKRQSLVIHKYLRAIFDSSRVLQAEVVSDTATSFDLSNGLRIETLTGDHRAIRAFTLVCAICDELAFFGIDEQAKVKSDTELVRAIRPALITTGGKLIALTTPYAARGWCYRQWKRDWGNDAGRTLVWRAPSTQMNPTLDQSVVDAALEDDLAAARSEYLAEWRQDVAEFLPRSLVESLVVKDRTDLLPASGRRYFAFVDLSGGQNDDAALCIAHKDTTDAGKRVIVVIDLLRRWRPPCNPHGVIADMAGLLKRYDCRRVNGDLYGAGFTVAGFASHGVAYIKAKPKGEVYLDALGRLCSAGVELPDNPALVDQLCALERRTRSGGHDSVDHPPGGHDDLANVVCGICCIAGKPIISIGVF